jgi:protein PhnA
MKLKRTPELYTFLTTVFPDVDADSDTNVTVSYASSAPADRKIQVISQVKLLIADPEFPFEELGTEANRWFSDAEEGRNWMRQILSALELSSSSSSEEVLVVKDTNGTPLSEGDSVQVIKDLKVKGGSSDLKRGTLIKKIHLIDDVEAIECRVDGSTLVLKTCFLKKA